MLFPFVLRITWYSHDTFKYVPINARQTIRGRIVHFFFSRIEQIVQDVVEFHKYLMNIQKMK